MKKIITSVISAVAGVALLAGCSSPTPEAQETQSVVVPTNFVEVSKADGKFEFTSLEGEKNKADLANVCADLFKWAQESGYTRYTLIDNTFALTDYENQGRPISNNESDDSPFIAACGSNLERLTEKGENASPEGPNKNRIIVFFGKFGENKDVLGNVFLTAAFKGAVKYVTLNGEFLPSKPSDQSTDSTVDDSNGDVSRDEPVESESPAETPAPEESTEG